VQTETIQQFKWQGIFELLYRNFANVAEKRVHWETEREERSFDRLEDTHTSRSPIDMSLADDTAEI